MAMATHSSVHARVQARAQLAWTVCMHPCMGSAKELASEVLILRVEVFLYASRLLQPPRQLQRLEVVAAQAVKADLAASRHPVDKNHYAGQRLDLQLLDEEGGLLGVELDKPCAKEFHCALPKVHVQNLAPLEGAVVEVDDAALRGRHGLQELVLCDLLVGAVAQLLVLLFLLLGFLHLLPSPSAECFQVVLDLTARTTVLVALRRGLWSFLALIGCGGVDGALLRRRHLVGHRLLHDAVGHEAGDLRGEAGAVG
mmetsp:Transcript_35704/g.96898  ORF Transcript_35704/g.96898 Transcript_35704/m.96898 type:complete len:255 (+) Transcript_35704:1-765(+)